MDTKVFDQKYKNLNEKQREAVDTIYGPVMVVAGPGTGKTTVLTLRIANILLKTDAKPDEILALTFTDSGVQAMRQKLREVVGDVSFRVNIFTFHGFSNYIRGLYPECFEKIGGRLPCDESDQIEIIEEILEKHTFKELRVSTFGIKIRDITRRISELKRENINTHKLESFIKKETADFEEWKSGIEKMNKTRETEIEKKQKYITRLTEFNKVFSLYEEALEEKSLYDFDDTILGLIDALSKHRDMLQEVRETFQFVLADEHQDANGAQNAILKFFKDEESPDDPNLFVVGDDKQSIFRFQGASLENFYAFEEDFPSARKIHLENNYRSHRIILDSTHSLISNDGRTHTKLKAHVSYEEKMIDINEFGAYEDEMQHTARGIESILKETKETDTIAVLARNNGTLKELAKYLESLSVPYSLAGDESLFDSFEYKKVSALFDAILDPLNSPKLLETFFFGYFKLPISDVLLLEDVARRERKTAGNVFLKGKEIINDVEDKVTFKNAKEKIESLVFEARKRPLLDFLKFLKGEISLFDNKDSFEVFRVLFEEAGRLVLKKRNATLGDFVIYLKRLETHHIALSISSKENRARVKLSSIHKSKGLEYDFVFVLDVTDKRFEKQSKKNDLLRIPGIGVDKELEEERRLLYVAMTRAKRHATLSYSLHGQKGGAMIPSILIDEIDNSLVSRNANLSFEPINLLSTPTISKESREILRETFLSRSFSVTALNNFLDCPFRYLFRNLLMIPDVSEFSALLGTACHNVLERFHREIKKGNIPSKKEINLLIEHAIGLLPFAENELELAIEKAEENVFAYINSFNQPNESEKMFIEESLFFPLLVQHEKGDFEIKINGKIDLAMLDGNKVHVIDFKSKKAISRNAILGKTASDDIKMMRQLQFYKFLWEKSKEGEIVNTGSLVFISPKNGNVGKETFELGEEDKNYIEKLTVEVLQKIYNFDFLTETCGKHDCEFCKMAQMFKI